MLIRHDGYANILAKTKSPKNWRCVFKRYLYKRLNLLDFYFMS